MPPSDKPKRSTAPRKHRPAASSAVARQAEGHSRVRRDHSDEIKEDYVELIAQLIREHGSARTVDLAERLGVSHVTVTKTVARLAQAGLVRTEPYRAIHLTPKGEVLAARSAERHKLVVEFLQRLGVSQRDAEIDAEGVEHHLSEATLEAMRKFINRA